MPQLDFTSMAILIALNLAVMGAALPLVMDNPVSQAARHAQRYFLLQGIGWAFILAAGRMRGMAWDAPLSVAAACAAAAAQWQMAQALQNWLGARRFRPVLFTLCLLGPLGFMVWLDNMVWRTAWFSLCHGLSVACLGAMCFYPIRPAPRSWRYLMAASACIMGVGLLSRSYLAAATPWLQEFAIDTGVNHTFAIMAQLCSTLVLVSILVAWRDETNQKLRDLAMTDQLTGLANRHALLQVAPRMLAHAQRQHIALAVLLLDLDHFKAVNDQYGHTQGDLALQLLARVLKAEMRTAETAARWGGEEFCLLIYAQPYAVEIFFQRLCLALSHRSKQELGFELRISAGCALQTQQLRELPDLLQRADAALYAAKASGRGCLVFEDSLTEPHGHAAAKAVYAIRDTA